MEQAFLKWLQGRLPASERWPLGVTDDAAELARTNAAPLVFAIDSLADGTHFKLEEVSPRRIGRKSLAVNLSDLAAMAARPLGALVSLTLPRDAASATTGDLARELIEGMLPLADEFGCPVVGGDTNVWSGGLVISVAVVGEATSSKGVWTRSGSRPGDVLLVTGELGGSILGKHFDFVPRLAEARLLAERYNISAAMDLSDGLSLDATRLAAASGCGLEMDVSTVPCSAAAVAVSRQSGKPAWEHALDDGEDFELLLAADEVTASRLVADQPLDVPITAVGKLTEDGKTWLIDEAGQRTPLVARGFEHR